jgi:UDP-N-acetylmuramoyl-L-alanyl-D-glutamate--2,6-diaminopimelate ligase
MKLKQLLKDMHNVVVRGSKEIEITGITANSKLVAPANIFVAKRGHKEDGAKYIPEAIQAGASCIASDMYDPTLKDVTQVICQNVIELEAYLAANYYSNPSQELWMVGVTGTNGKTTTSYGIKHVLDKTASLSGLIGTIEYYVGKSSFEAMRTTPDVSSNHRLLRDMVRSGCKSCVMEVTSHALEQGRVLGIEYDVAVFTNLTHDHLDYHKNMENYCKAKNLLFRYLTTSLGSKVDRKKWAIVNSDSDWMPKIVEGTYAHVLTYGLDSNADIKASHIAFSQKGTSFSVTYKEKEIEFFWPLVGRFNVYNALAVIGVSIAKGIPFDNLPPLLASFHTAPGRLEKVDNPLGLHIFVDYAHSDDALRNVLKTLRECTKGRLITVFGCGGDRDKEKRPKMASCVEELSDVAVITQDNPRSEDPQEICNQICKGFSSHASYIVEMDRKKAIQRAVEIAKPEDIILIAGKGHETKQYLAGWSIDFDDRKVARQCCEEVFERAILLN